jgi:catechol 2,3-dioxygenase-like lactoylglutathione lyase family enzyme
MPALLSVKSLIPLVSVQSVPRSIAFYEKLGFEVRRTHTPEGDPEPIWAWLTSDAAQVMLACAEAPVDPGAQGVLFYVYCPDVAGFRSQLVAAGVDAGPISSPFYAPRGEFRITDPDGYVMMVSHT